MNEETPRKSHAAVWIYSTLAALLLYVLASGPLGSYALLYGKMGITLERWNWFYAPLVQFTRATGTEDWLNRYTNWCDSLFP